MQNLELKFEFHGDTLPVFFGKVANGESRSAWISVDRLSDAASYRTMARAAALLTDGTEAARLTAHLIETADA